MTDEAPERTAHPDDWKPHPGPQDRFLRLTCFEALYGGAAGGGKSDALLIDAVRYVGRGYGPHYKALLLRRTFPDLEKSLIDRSRELYPRIGGVYREDKRCWRFPQGEKVYFGYLELEKHKLQYQGAAFCFVGFDELTHFTETQYLYLFSRTRSAHGIRCRVRGATNPGGDGHEWVFRRFGAWLNPEHPKPAPPGEVRHYVPLPEGGEEQVPRGTRDFEGNLALGRTFVPAKLEDNPNLLNDATYRAALAMLDPVTREQLRKGNWLIKPAAGEYFKRSWVKFLDVLPAGGTAVRAWDLAGTAPSKDNPNPDWTVGVKLYTYSDGTFVIADVVRMRGTPGDVEKFVKATAELDGKSVAIRLPQDPAQAGKYQANAYAKLLVGYSFSAAVMSGDKIARFGPFSSQAQAGNVYLLRGAWNQPYVEGLEQFPDGDHDDDADATSEAFNRRVEPPKKQAPPPPPAIANFEDSGIG